jgi:DNA ligase-1
MSKREFLQLAHTYTPNKQSVGGWYASEKLDGMRAYWDGGWTRGRLTSEVPFANTLKDFIRVNPVHSTGLWSRYGKPIAAPNWWLDRLPPFPLDGELYAGVGMFQRVMSVVKKHTPVDYEWKEITYRIFDLPSDYEFLGPGKINNPQWSADFEDMRDLAPNRLHGPMTFHTVCRMLELKKLSLGTGSAVWQQQIRLPIHTELAERELARLLESVLELEGEGVILRNPSSIWEPRRTWNLLKVKPSRDSEATVIGYTWGKGKLEGLMGSMLVDWEGVQFELSGFTDAERKMVCNHKGFDPRDPGTVITADFLSLPFPIGSTVSFKYRELTDDGKPKEARYWRKR